MNANRIGVFDIDPEGRRHLAETVRAALLRGGARAEVVEFDAIPAMARACHGGRYDMAFVVVEGMKGVDAAWTLRDNAPECALFLVSSSGDYALEGYRQQAVDYLLKPVTPERALDAMRYARRRLADPVYPAPGCANTSK